MKEERGKEERVSDATSAATTCSSCGEAHAKRTYTYDDLANVTRLKKSSLFSYHSRGGFLPAPLPYTRGRSPRWHACEVHRWMIGTLPADRIEAPRTPAQEVATPKSSRKGRK